MKARLPAALTTVYDANDSGPRPGEQRKQVFDFEDGVRCVVSIDHNSEANVLHLSFSCQDWTKLQVIEFLNRIEAIPVEFWPDMLLLELRRFQTSCAIHVIYEVPLFFKVCESIPRTGSFVP